MREPHVRRGVRPDRSVRAGVGDGMPGTKCHAVAPGETYPGPFIRQRAKGTFTLKLLNRDRRYERRTGGTAGTHPPATHRWKIIMMKALRFLTYGSLVQNGERIERSIRR